ncbi:MAG: alpha/beta hydrolase [Bacteroidota bacterium]
MTKKKKNPVPLAYRLIQWSFPKLEFFAQPLANRWSIKLFFTPMRFKTPDKELQAESSAEKYSVVVDNQRIQCYSWGSGPVIIMVHGWSGRGTQFSSFIEPLVNKGYKVVTFDGPAHGQSVGKRTDIPEFGGTLLEVAKPYKDIRAVIAHSFGGLVSLYAMEKGLAARTLINIGSPAISDAIISDFLKRINGSPKVGHYFKNYIVKKFGRSFDEFSGLKLVKKVSDLKLLLVHDEKDYDVTIEHPYAMKGARPETDLFITSGLGHRKILRDKEVIDHCISFIEDAHEPVLVGV